MNRSIAALVVSSFVVTPATVLAAEHLMTVSEVMLSHGGDDTAQFVEFSDPGEPFPGTPYHLSIWDADANNLANIEIDVPPGTTVFLVSTPTADTALSVTGDAVLTTALPQNGQACFSYTEGVHIHCLAWGCINELVKQTAPTGATPPDGQSLNRQPNGDYHIADPTPGASNNAGVEELPCPDRPDAGPTPDAGAVEPDAATANSDAGTTTPPINSDDDCSCTVGSRQELPRGPAALVVLLGALVMFRRRRSAR